MTIAIPNHLEDRIQRMIDSGRFRDSAAVIGSALDALDAEEKVRVDKLRELVLAGHNSPIIGELNAEMWERIAREAERT
jgi:putative addiction module CopG family antidote